jgi:hypothetical protein
MVLATVLIVFGLTGSSSAFDVSMVAVQKETGSVFYDKPVSERMSIAGAYVRSYMKAGFQNVPKSSMLLMKAESVIRQHDLGKTDLQLIMMEAAVALGMNQ